MANHKDESNNNGNLIVVAILLAVILALSGYLWWPHRMQDPQRAAPSNVSSLANNPAPLWPSWAERIKGTKAEIVLTNDNGVTWFKTCIYFTDTSPIAERPESVCVKGYTDTEQAHQHAFTSGLYGAYWIKDGVTKPLPRAGYFDFGRGRRDFELQLPADTGPARLEFCGAQVYDIQGLVNWDEHPNIRIDIAADGSLTFWHYMMKEAAPLSR